MLNKMTSWLDFITIVILSSISLTTSEYCEVSCPKSNDESVCAFDAIGRNYTLFPGKCEMARYMECYKIDFIQTSLKYCLKDSLRRTRRYYEESCPVFCPNHYRPVCAASRVRDYFYRTFNNGCHLDMLNCRGENELTSYVEVPLEFCQRHLMKNIYREQIVVGNVHDYRDYD